MKKNKKKMPLTKEEVEDRANIRAEELKKIIEELEKSQKVTQEILNKEFTI